MERKYDLDDRCVTFGAAIVKFTDQLPRSMAGIHLGKQLLRSGTAPALHYGEVQGAESIADFLHKMKVALKELRESKNNMRIQEKAGLLNASKTDHAWLLMECNELIAIFTSSIKTAQANAAGRKK